ncbi:MAG: MMPL family transporter [Candidatus Altiarchaeota archaeon]|nr:MMPL family transporter [Candidatus Altiarchaeota archaeon]
MEALDRISGIQLRHATAITLATIAITIVLAFGMLQIRLETDFSKELPQDNPAIILQNRIRDTFGGMDMILILVEVDPTSGSKEAVDDIRDPRVIKMLSDLENEVMDEPGVDKTQSVAQAFSRGGIPEDVNGVQGILDNIPGSRQFFNRDYTATVFYTYTNLGSSNEKIKAMTKNIESDIEEVAKPPGTRLRITGMPSIRTTLMDILVSDAKYTMALASIIILMILIVLNKPITRGFFVFLPLMLGLIWTLGTMGWLDIPLSIVTVGVGAMILGLGVEYSVFYESVYRKERAAGKTQEEALKIALNEVGMAIIGSSTTTIVGFLSLLFASMPMLHHLGLALALGITYCVLAALLVNPSFIVIEENIVHKMIRDIIRGGGT